MRLKDTLLKNQIELLKRLKMKTMKPETLNAIINYLVQQPYKDVAGLLQMIQQDLQSKEKPVED